MAGCRCKVCRSRNPRDNRLRTAASLHFDSGEVVLIDTSTDLRAQALKFEIERVDSVLFTHSHADHILGIDDLRAYNFLQREPIPCFGTTITWDQIRRTFWYIFERDPGSAKSSIPSIIPNILTPYEPITVFGETITPFPLEHGGMEVLGFKVRNVAYATDCNRIPERSLELLRGLDCLILDGIRFEPHPTHFSVPEAIAVAEEVKPRQTYLIHLTHSIDHEVDSLRLPTGIQFAYDGLEITI
jgi:phosphoribosyl 1,2-cyclic phosphate phosphodiesterase